jgi:predicted phosphodiesterase
MPADLEQFFFRPRPTTTQELVGQRRQTSAGFEPPPPPTGAPPYRMSFASLLPSRARAVEQAGQLAFHVVGDTGGVNGRGAQQNVADHMTAQIHERDFDDQPSFFYHLGDVVYFHGEESQYHDQFYHPYQDYPAPIFAIPGNHDGDPKEAQPSLVPFMNYFCAKEATHPVVAGHSDRPTMTQPNCYWTLEAPFATIVGLYSNVTGELDNVDAGQTTQRDWLVEELRAAPTDKALLLAVHHPIYSLGSHGPTVRVAEALESAFTTSGRYPDVILSGHEHNYQRFTRKLNGREIPYLVIGAGGQAGYTLPTLNRSLKPPKGVKLRYADDDRPGFMTLTVNREKVVGRYYVVPEAGNENAPAKRVDKFTLDLRTHEVR